MITRNTHYRTLGDVPYAVWKDVILGAGGPVPLADIDVWVSAKPHSALALVLMGLESKWATASGRNRPMDTYNPFSFRVPDYSNEDTIEGYIHFRDWQNAMEHLKDRVTNGNYWEAGGWRDDPYNDAETLGELLHVYAPPQWNDTDRLIREAIDYLEAWLPGERTNDMADTITFGNVPKPKVYERHLNYSSHGMIGYSSTPIVVEGIVYHRMIGTLWGTDNWFKAGKAATEYGIGVAATDGGANAGVIIEWIDPANGHFYGHSSGPVNKPYGDGKRFVDRFGTARVNPQTVAIEISGNYDTPLDNAARGAIIQLSAYFADQRGIPWDEYPIVPGQDRSFVHWHQEFTIGTGKVCPGNVVMGETGALIAATAEYMRNYQVLPAPPDETDYAQPSPVAPGTRVINGRRFLGVDREYTLRRDSTPRLWADPSPATGPTIPMGSTITVSHVVKDEGIEADLTLVLEDGSRIPADDVVTLP